jgi:phosphoglycerol transferase
MSSLIHRTEALRPRSKPRHWTGTALHASAAMLLFTLLFVWIGGVTRLDLNAPLIYNGDALEMLSYFDQQYIEDDMNLRLHAPFELQHKETWRYAYNALQHSNSDLMWAAYLVGGNTVRAMNFYFLATFLLIFASAYWVIGRLGLSNPFRFGAATLYALMPCHFQRNVGHLYESSYYLIPLLALVLVLLWRRRPLAHRIGPDGWRFDPLDRRLWWIIALLVLLASFHPYHQFFFAALAASIAPLAGWYRQSWRPVLIGFGLAVIALVPLVAQPVIERWLADPQLALSLNGQAIGGYGGAETFPLKMIQIILPVQGHRWPVLAHIRAVYDAVHPLNNENSTTSLGLIGAIGFLICLVAALLPSRTRALGTLHKAGLIVLIGVLFASMGGISSMISTASNWLFGPTFPLTEARGWNRMILFIGFFAYFAAFGVLRHCLIRLHRRYFPRLPTAIIVWPAFIAVMAFAFWDQIPGPIEQQSTSSYYNDQRFFAQIEGELPAGARVFQAPFVVHHVSGWVLPDVYYTDQLRPYIASRTLHFTFGSDQGTPQELWYAAASKLAPDQQAPYLCDYGFSGILLHRNMVKDPAAVEKPLQAQLGAAPIVSQDGQFAFFDLRPYCERHAIRPLDLDPIRAHLMQQLADRGAIFLGAGDMASLIGQLYADTDGSISRVATADEDGFQVYGPWLHLLPGRYSATFDLALNGNGTVTLDVAAQRNEQTASLTQTILSGGTTHTQLSLEFEAAPGDSGFEFRVYKPRGIAAQVFGVAIHPLKP